MNGKDIKYPLYVFELDDRTFRIVSTENGLSWYERPDVEADLYEGWDSRGSYFKLIWSDSAHHPVIFLDDAKSSVDFVLVADEYVKALEKLVKIPPYLATRDEIHQALRKL